MNNTISMRVDSYDYGNQSRLSFTYKDDRFFHILDKKKEDVEWGDLILFFNSVGGRVQRDE